jgi:DNA-binding PadR family transcriptional regulator
MKADQTLGVFELMIMLALIRLAHDAYGVALARDIESVTGRTVALGSVYTTLERLEEKGLVDSTVGEPTARRGGRAKRYFHVSTRGLRAVRETQRVLAALDTGTPRLAGETA